MLEILLHYLKQKAFWISFITVFIVVALQVGGFSLPKITLPNFSAPTVQKVDVFNTIIPKLQQKQNTFQLRKPAQFVQSAFAAQSYDNAAAYAVVDYDTGTILAGKKTDTILPIASLTKVMTAVVALDLATPDTLFTATKTVLHTIPTHIAIEPGEKITLTELLNASLLTSANDAVHVIKEGIDIQYGEKVFIKAMNEKAKILGLQNTHFTNPQGFDSPRHYSTVEDMAILTHYALTNYPLILEIVKKDYELLPENQYHKEFSLINWNGLIDVYPGAFGVKIGNTGDAGKTTIVAAEREEKKLIALVLGAPGVLERDLWAAELLDLGFQRTSNLPPIEVTEEQLRGKYSKWVY